MGLSWSNREDRRTFHFLCDEPNSIDLERAEEGLKSLEQRETYDRNNFGGSVTLKQPSSCTLLTPDCFYE